MDRPSVVHPTNVYDDAPALETISMKLGERALEHIRHLAENIGPRPTGSIPEAEAFAYTEEFFQSLGLATQRDPIDSIRPHRSASWFYLVLLTLLMLGVLFVEQAPLFIPALILLTRFVIAPLRLNMAANPVRGGSNSFNIIAEQPPLSSKPKAILILGAHLDTAVARVYYKTGWRKTVRKVFGFTGFLIVFALLLASLILEWPLRQIFDASTAERVTRELRLVAKVYMVAIWLYLMFNVIERLLKPMIFAPGANDNASGVAAVLALAEHYAANPPRNITLRYILFCGEEVGLVGSARYADKLRTLEKNRLYMLNFDMVGTGDQVKYVRPGTHGLLNSWLREGGATGGSLIGFGSSDFRSFSRHDIPAAGLYTVGNKMIFDVYHSTEDILTYISPAALDKTIAAAQTLVQRLDEQAPRGRT